jgi:hypothetical protein
MIGGEDNANEGRSNSPCEANGIDYILGLTLTAPLRTHVGGLEASTVRFKADPTGGKVRAWFLGDSSPPLPCHGVRYWGKLSPFDLLAGIVTDRIRGLAPLSALLTLWLSMIAVVGLASLPACSRACT